VHTNPLLEFGQISRAQSISLGDDRNQVDTSAQSLHDFDIQWLERVTSGADEVETSMDTQVNLFRPAWLLLLQHVRLMLVIEELDDGLPRVAVVHVVAEARGINHREAN
jgi:hypothetical protein